MAEELLDELADGIVSGLKWSFTHRINNGEDPTTCMEMFLNFLDSNKEKNPQLFKKIASRIASSFFAPFRRVNQIPSPDNFIAAYHNLVNKLIEINPQMPYRADYEKQKASIEDNKKLIKERLGKEKEEKKKIVDNEYRKLLSEREKEYKKSGSGEGLRIGFIVCFVLFFLVLLADILFHVPSSQDEMDEFVVLFGIIGAIIGSIFVVSLAKKWGCAGWLLGLVVGGTAGGGLGWVCIHYTPYSIFSWLVLGLILAATYGSKVATVRLSPEERSACYTSLDNIEKHFSDKEKYEIAQSTVKILTMDEQ